MVEANATSNDTKVHQSDRLRPSWPQSQPAKSCLALKKTNLARCEARLAEVHAKANQGQLLRSRTLLECCVLSTFASAESTDSCLSKTRLETTQPFSNMSSFLPGIHFGSRSSLEIASSGQVARPLALAVGKRATQARQEGLLLAPGQHDGRVRGPGSTGAPDSSCLCLGNVYEPHPNNVFPWFNSAAAGPAFGGVVVLAAGFYPFCRGLRRQLTLVFAPLFCVRVVAPKANAFLPICAAVLASCPAVLTTYSAAVKKLRAICSSQLLEGQLQNGSCGFLLLFDESQVTWQLNGTQESELQLDLFCTIPPCESSSRKAAIKIR